VNSLNRRKRQYILFLLAVVLPASLLSALAFRFLGQEEELSRERALVEYNNAIDSSRRELAARLDAIKLEALNALNGTASDGPAKSGIVFVTNWNKDGLELHWDHPQDPILSSGKFISLRDAAEKLEYQSNDPVSAAQTYRQAILAARQPAERCEALLSLGRTLVKAKLEQEALKIYREMLSGCDRTSDEAGLPFTLYAANRLIDLNLDIPAATDYLVREVNTGRLRSVAESTMIRNLLQSIQGDAVETARRNVAQQIAAVEQVTAYSKEFAKALVEEYGHVGKVDQKWFAYGPEPLLLTAIPATPASAPLFYAVSASVVTPVGTRLIGQHTEQSIPMGSGFTNVEFVFDPPRTFTGGRVPARVYTVGLAFILGLAVLGGYLLLYGVNRDLQMTEMRSQFVSSVSHELRTPLTAIRMFAETLALGRAGDDQARSEYLDTIVSESERLARLVDNVLDFSKIEQGKKIYRLRPTSLTEVVRSAARAMRYPLAKQGFTLDISIDEDLPLLPADADAIEQAIFNLLSNAMKYSGDARRVELRLERDREVAAIKVVDRGIGISVTDQQHIFDKFYRVTSNQTNLIAGTGLGLTLVKHIAEAHGGRVDVQSAVGAGSTFTIRIPFTTAEVSS
jgi:two-component sensor histidine kinase